MDIIGDNTNKFVYKTRVVFKIMDFEKQLDTNWIDIISIKSDKFIIGSDEWYCGVKLNGEKFGLFLYLSRSSELPIQTQYDIFIIYNNNKLFAKTKIDQTFDDILNGWGLSSFITKQLLIDNKDILLTDNTLTIGFDITVYKRNNCHQNCGAKCHRFAQLFGIEELADCRLIVGKDLKVIFVSKLILSLHSEVFEKMFTTDCIEKTTNEVVITDIDSNVFEQFLNYLYTGKCDKLDEMTEDLLYVANKYMVSSLKTICLNLIYLQINGRNALQTLKLFQDFGADKELMKKVSESIAENITSVVKQEFTKHYAIDGQNISQIVKHLGNQLIKPKTKLMFYTYK
ncbi:protein roadkill-like [Oppia nitens]|uniref:protein roadkill-like n=1 Tax=Oppia nitens TaxID=1686743 RepID=UPI0023D9B26E|nr:protein roadkill-like [Oppia nitens]